MRATVLKALAMLLFVAVAGCATQAPSSSPSPSSPPAAGIHARAPVGHGFLGQLRGDPRSGCTWIDNRGSSIQTLWPRDITVVFSPLRLIQAGKVVASDGDFVYGELVSDQPVRGRPGCPVRHAEAAATIHSAGRTRPPRWP